MKRILISLFIAVSIFGVFEKASAGDKDLKMHGINILKLQIADLEAALLEEKYKRAQDRKRLIKVLDLWEHNISYTDANAYNFNQKTGRYVKKKVKETKKPEPKKTKETKNEKVPAEQTETKASDKKPPEEPQESKEVKEVTIKENT
jgi:hypothetical protein